VAPLVGQEAESEDSSTFKMQNWSRVHALVSLHPIRCHPIRCRDRHTDSLPTLFLDFPFSIRRGIFNLACSSATLPSH
jgi:hypothetical protein